MMRGPASAEARIGKIFQALDKAYPDAHCALVFRNPLELLVATILSAQCTDVLVNKVTAELFQKYQKAQDYADAKLPDLQRDTARVNFYRTKARNIQGACRMIVERFGGKVPETMEDLLLLPGVARKTANVILGNAFGVNSGIVVDTHVLRLSLRIGLSAKRDREKVERDLMSLVPRPLWTRFSHLVITHGRRVCSARKPNCPSCPLGPELCPSHEVSDTS